MSPRKTFQSSSRTGPVAVFLPCALRLVADPGRVRPDREAHGGANFSAMASSSESLMAPATDEAERGQRAPRAGTGHAASTPRQQGTGRPPWAASTCCNLRSPGLQPQGEVPEGARPPSLARWSLRRPHLVWAARRALQLLPAGRGARAGRGAPWDLQSSRAATLLEL